MSILEHKVQEPLVAGVEFQFSNPLAAGLRLAWTHKRALLLLGAVPLILELLITEDEFKNALADRVVYFIHTPLLGLAHAWRLTAIAIYVLQQAQGRTQSLAAIGINALQNLPKILISFTLLFILSGVGTVLPPLMCFVVFFIWAPFFCIGELFVPDSVNARQDDDDYGGWDDDPAEPEPLRVFARRGVFELGFGRSIALASRNLAPTLQIAALFWFLSAVPQALVFLYFGAQISLAGLMLESLVGAIAAVFAAGTASAVFIELLGKEARLELGLPLENQAPAAGFGPFRRPLRFDKMFMAMMALVISAAAATWYQGHIIELRRSIPADAVIEPGSSVVEGERIAVSLRLTDPRNELRWLDPNRFVLSVGGPADEKEMRSGIGLELLRGLGAPPPDQAQGDRPPAKDLAPLSRAYPFDAEGQPIEESKFSPYGKPLKMVLYFSIPDIDLAPKPAAGDTAAAAALPAADAGSHPVDIYLYYSTYEGLGKPIYHGSVNLQAR